MTFLILLISIAVLEYVMRRPDPPPRRGQPVENQDLKTIDPDALATLAPALGQLGRALDQFGRGVAPQPGTPKPVQPPANEEKKV